MSFEILKYDSSLYEIWNQFISESKNGSFLFDRNFMEYHSDKFVDFSLLIYKDDKLVAVLPANTIGNEIHSHQGLTYGGLVVSEKLRTTDFFEIFNSILLFFNELNFAYLYIKGLPHFYTTQFSDEIKYLQFILNAEVYRKDICSVIHFDDVFAVSKSVKRDCKKSIEQNNYIEFDSDFDVFWSQVLEPNLNQKFQTKPVHSLDDIKKLKAHFPNQIFQVNIFSETGEILGGTTLFISNHVVHSQYISMKKDLNLRGVLDHLHIYVIEKFQNDKKYFDFGISNENQGRNINKGLFEWKEKFGARPGIQEFYKFKTKDFLKFDQLYL